MDVKIDAEAVERAVADAIVNSAIGAKIKVAVHELLSKSWDNPIDKAVSQVIAGIALQVIRDEYGEQIKQAVREKLAEETLTELVGRCLNVVLELKS